MKDGPSSYQGPRAIFIEEYTNDWTEGKNEEYLEGRDPGNGATRIVSQRANFIICLKATHT